MDALRRALAAYRQVLVLVGRVEQWAVVLLLVNIVVCITAQVISRYAFGKPLVWVEEVATYSFIWGVFLGSGLALKYDRHLRIETFVDRLGRVGSAAFRTIGIIFVLGLLLSLLPTLWVAIDIEMRRMTIALPVQIPSAWFFSVPLLVGVVSMIVTSLYHLLVECHRAFGGDAPRPIAGDLLSHEVEEDTESERILAGGNYGDGK